MELTTKGRYAVMAMADIARHGQEAAVPLSAVAERQQLPLAYLEQLFGALRRAGLVESARGRSGGFRLVRPAAEISVAEVMAGVEEDILFTRCDSDRAGCRGASPCITHDLWQALGDTTKRFLNGVNLDDLANGRQFQVAVPERLDGSGAAARVYLDYNATAPLLGAARDAMITALDLVGNPSSVHQDGRRVRGAVEDAREKVAALVGAKPSEVVFTSGASEANTWVMQQNFDCIITTAIEHESILEAARAADSELVIVDCDEAGVVDTGAIADAVLKRPPEQRILISVQAANNETGILQPIEEIAAFAQAQDVFLHIDAVQVIGRLPVDFTNLNADFISISAHKMGGPKGIGALVVRDRIDPVPLVRGGGQERRRRAGTENVPAIVGFGAAAGVAVSSIDRQAAIAKLRDVLESAVCDVAPQTVIVNSQAPARLANTSLLALPGSQAETLVIKLDLAGISVSAGSACSSGKVGVSHVLTAMGLDDSVTKGAIRVSLGSETTEEDVRLFVNAWKRIAGQAALAA